MGFETGSCLEVLLFIYRREVSVGAMLLGPSLMFVRCAGGTYVSQDMGSSCSFSPKRRTLTLVPSWKPFVAWDLCSERVSAVKG